MVGGDGRSLVGSRLAGSNLHDLLFLGMQGLVDDRDMIVGHLLNIICLVFVFVLGNFVVFLQAF